MFCAPSFLSCDFNKLEHEINSVRNAKWLHFDVMDGEFVSSRTYDFHMLKLIKQISNQFFDCHLMIAYPEKYYERYILSGANLITFHYEATKHSKALIKAIKARKVKVGISIKPDTDVSVLDDLLKYLDVVLIMSVEPGKGGQKFIYESLEKIKYLDDLRKEKGYNYLIEVDGGINIETAKLVKAVGCDVVVVGSYIFNSKDRNEIISRIENV